MILGELLESLFFHVSFSTRIRHKKVYSRKSTAGSHLYLQLNYAKNNWYEELSENSWVLFLSWKAGTHTYLIYVWDLGALEKQPEELVYSNPEFPSPILQSTEVSLKEDLDLHT